MDSARQEFVRTVRCNEHQEGTGEAFEKAIELDPEYVPAYLGYADANRETGCCGGWGPRTICSMTQKGRLREG